MTKNPDKIFAICLLLAASIHAILLSTINVTWPHKFASTINQTLTVLLMTREKNVEHLPAESIAINNKSSTTTKTNKTNIAHIETKSQKPKLKTSIENSSLPLEINQQTSTSKEDTKSTANLEQIMESAHEIARQEAHQLEKTEHLKNSDTASKSIVSTAIGAAFNQPKLSGQQKIKSFSDGMLEITKSDGSKYCLFPSKDFQRGGPVEAQNIPMTCP